MTVVLLDPRFPSMIPVDAVAMLSGKVSYTEEVPIRIRWVIGDLGGHTVYESDVLVTTDLRNDQVIERIEEGDELIAAPSLLVHLSPDREIEPVDSGAIAPAHAPALPSAEAIGQAMSGMGEQTPEDALESYKKYAHAVDDAYQQSAHLYHPQEESGEEDYAADAAASAAYSGEGFVEGEVLSADEHTAAVAGSRRTARTEVPESVMDEIEDAVALMARSLRQGKWEQSMTHADLLPYLREETEELATTIELREVVAAVGSDDQADGDGEVPEWAEQDLCDELSDVLLQVLFHAEIANRRGAFDIGHVAGAFVAKLRDRAPYLFEEVERAVGIQEQDELWLKGKEEENRRKRAAYGPAFSDYLDRKAEMKQMAKQRAERAKRGEEPAPSHHGEERPQAAAAANVAKAPAEAPAKKPAKDSAENPAEKNAPAQPTQQANPAQASQPHADQWQAQPKTQPAQPQAPQQPAQQANQDQQSNAAQQQAQQSERQQLLVAQPQHTSALSAADEIIREARERGLRDSDIPTDIRYPMVGLELDEPGGAEDRLLKAVQKFRQQLDRQGR